MVAFLLVLRCVRVTCIPGPFYIMQQRRIDMAFLNFSKWRLLHIKERKSRFCDSYK